MQAPVDWVWGWEWRRVDMMGVGMMDWWRGWWRVDRMWMVGWRGWRRVNMMGLRMVW